MRVWAEMSRGKRVSKRDKVGREVNYVSSKSLDGVCCAMMRVLDLLGKGISKTQDDKGGRFPEAIPAREID